VARWASNPQTSNGTAKQPPTSSCHAVLCFEVGSQRRMEFFGPVEFGNVGEELDLLAIVRVEME
jgi:hypothetical protein